MNMQSPSDYFPLSRADAQQRLASFLPFAAKTYAVGRNQDLGAPGKNAVSTLSPAIRRRLITEQEVVEEVLREHGLDLAEKFIQEVCWRSYWKGWLEQRPEIWTRYRKAAEFQFSSQASEMDWYPRVMEAEAGSTGLTCFDDWVQELTETGYLHNHARMWFASIWIFTLGLPWERGAAFFARHLIDGDPASNTLSWRWVAGLHTKGKTYKTLASNIRKNTGGRYHPGVEVEAAFPGPPYEELPERKPVLFPEETSPQAPTLLLCAEDWALDCPAVCMNGTRRVVLIGCPPGRKGWEPSQRLQELEERVHREARSLWSSITEVLSMDVDAFSEWWMGLEDPHTETKMLWVPVGLTREKLDVIWATSDQRPQWIIRDWDRRAWPHAKSGFFGFWKKLRPFLQS